MKYIKLFTILTFFIFYAGNSYCQISEDSIKMNLSKLTIALKNKDVESIGKYLASNYSLKMETWPVCGNYLKTILERQDFDQVELVENSVRIQDGATHVNVKFHLQNNKTEESIIGIDSSHKILFIDYFDRLFGNSRYRDSYLVETLPFERDGESVILKIRLNDDKRELSFLLDTGADGMAIRKTLADSLNLRIGHSQTANMVGAEIRVDISNGNTVHLSDSLSLKNQRIAIFESVRSVDGIIGLNLIKQYITEINFDEELIYLYSFGNHRHAGNGVSIPINNPFSLILVPSSLDLIGKKVVEGNFIMDTGAKYHLILFSQFVRKNRLLLSGFKPEGEGTTVSMGYSSPVFYGKASEFKLGNDIVLKNMPVTLQASSGRSQTRSDIPDGSIGISFFSNFNITIDLLKKELYLEPRKQ